MVDTVFTSHTASDFRVKPKEDTTTEHATVCDDWVTVPAHDHAGDYYEWLSRVEPFVDAYGGAAGR